MAKKSKKANKVAESNVAVQAVEQVFTPEGMNWDVGVSEETKKGALDLIPKKGINWDEVYLGAEEVEENKSNGGSKKAEVIEAESGAENLGDIIREEMKIPVGGFNRAGMDAMLTEHIGPEIVVNVAQKVTKKSTRIKLSGGYRGTVRKMLLEDATGEEIITTIAAMYQEKEGKSYEYGFARGKRILGDMELELKRGVFSKEETA